MLNPTLHFKPAVLTLCMLSLFGCGGSSDEQAQQVTASPPTISVTLSSSTVDEASSVTISHSAKDYQGNTISSALSCDIGSVNGNVFTAPVISTDTTATCLIVATDSGNRSTTESVSIQITNLAPSLSMPEESAAAAAKLTSFDISFANIPAGYVDATLNGESIKLGVTEDNQLVYFPKPDSSGQQVLQLTLDGETVSYTFDVAPITDVITDPLNYISEHFNALTTIVNNKLNDGSANLSASEVETLTSIKTFLDNASYNGLSEADLTFLAYILQQNQQQFDLEEALNSTGDQLVSWQQNYGVNSMLRADLSDCEKAALLVVVSAAATTKLIVASGALAATGIGTSVSLAALAAGGATLGLTFTGIDLYAEKCYGPAEAWLDELAETNVSDRLVPKSSVFGGPSAAMADDISLVFNDGKVKHFQLNQQYSLLSGADSLLAKVNSAMAVLKSMLYKTIDLLDQYAPAVLSDLVKVVKSFATEYSEVKDASQISLTNLNGNNISGSLFSTDDHEQAISLKFEFIEETDIPTSGVADFTFTLENAADGISIPVTAKLYNDDVPDIVFIWQGKELGLDTQTLEATMEVTPGDLTTPASFQLLNKGLRAIELSKVISSSDAFTLSNLNSARLDGGEQLPVSLQFALQPSNKTTSTLTFGQTEFSDFDRSFNVNAVINYAGSYLVEVIESSSVEDCARDPRTTTYGLTKVDYDTYTLQMSENHTATFRASGSTISASGSHTFAEDEGMTTESYNISVNYKGEVSGGSGWSWKSDNSSLECTGSSTFTGLKN